MSKKILNGKVSSNKMKNTVVVSVELPKKHPLYNKIIRNTKKFMAHYEGDVPLFVGSDVRIQECLPYSKNVVWEVVDLAEGAAQ